MAPELFLGARPSTRTDIFSLGVTLYEALTRQHPFIGAETGHRLRPLLRYAPIRVALKERGNEIKPLVLLIVAALELNPERRPASYPALLFEAGLHIPKPAPPRSDVVVDDVVAKAVMFRQQGRHQEALVLLRKAMEDRPTNPLLLNSYAILLKLHGKHTEARDAWKLAVESLTFTSGRHEHWVYFDPAVNLAGQMISAREFKEAEALLRSAQQWANGRTLLSDYVEFGWWYLYRGRFADACNAILAAYKSKAPAEASLLWLTLAAWLSGRFDELATKLAEYYLMLPRLDVQTALCACVVATHCRQPRATKLFDAAYRDSESELNSVAKDLGLQPPTLTPPLHKAVSKTIIRSLDVMLTAGKYSELIG